MRSESLFRSGTWVGHLPALHLCRHQDYIIGPIHSHYRSPTLRLHGHLVLRFRHLLGPRERFLAAVDLEVNPQELPPLSRLKHTDQSWFYCNQGAPRALLALC